MVIVNRIVNILILLAAIAAVVFSYLLFSKREKLVNGWAQMASAITVAAKTVDDGGASGTSAVRDLPEAKLKHTNSDELGQVLPKLKDNIAKVITQRNELADSMRSAASQLAVSGVDAKNLKSVTSYKDQERIFLTGVQNFRKQRDNVSSEYSKTFRQFGVSVSVSDLNNPQKYRSAINSGNLKIRDVLTRRDVYSSYLTQIASAAGVKPPQVNGLAYRDELKRTVQDVKKKSQELAQTKRNLAAAERDKKRLQDLLAARERSIKSLNASHQAKQQQIDNLNALITRSGTLKVPEKYLTAKDPECYRYVKGIVEYIDKDYGFITINIGKNYSFVQQYGTQSNRVYFPLKAGTTMTVVRNMDSPNPLFIGKIIVTKVDENSSVCNLVSGKSDLLQQGDTVMMIDEDIDKVLAAKSNKAK